MVDDEFNAIAVRLIECFDMIGVRSSFNYEEVSAFVCCASTQMCGLWKRKTNFFCGLVQCHADISMAFSSTYLTECFVVGDLVDFYLIQQVRRIYFDEDANAGLLRVSKPKTQRTSYRQQCQ